MTISAAIPLTLKNALPMKCASKSLASRWELHQFSSPQMVCMGNHAQKNQVKMPSSIRLVQGKHDVCPIVLIFVPRSKMGILPSHIFAKFLASRQMFPCCTAHVYTANKSLRTATHAPVDLSLFFISFLSLKTRNEGQDSIRQCTFIIERSILERRCGHCRLQNQLA